MILDLEDNQATTVSIESDTERNRGHYSWRPCNGSRRQVQLLSVLSLPSEFMEF